MKIHMEDIDKLIKETLTEEETKFYDELEEKNIFGAVLDVFKGKNSWIAIVMNIVNLIVFGFLIYCIIQFFDAEATNELIKWASAGFICMSFMSMIKLYIWMQVDKKTIIKEMKRIEILISSMSHKISE